MAITLKFEAGLVPVIKHGTHDQKDHGNWAHGFSEEISNWNPHDSIPDSPRNAGGMTRKMWDAWEHGPDGQPFVELFRKYACEELGLAVPKPLMTEAVIQHLCSTGDGERLIAMKQKRCLMQLQMVLTNRPYIAD